jgi:anti-sigma factor RsiW
MPHELSCKELVELVTDYLEGTLPEDRRVDFDAHLTECEGCTNYLAEMRQTITLTGTLSEADLSPEARDTLLKLFHDWKDEQD